jgi:hypothetical protein
MCPDFIMEQLDFDYCGYGSVYDTCMDYEVSCYVMASVGGVEVEGTCDEIAEQFNLDTEDPNEEECYEYPESMDCPQEILDYTGVDMCSVDLLLNSCMDDPVECQVTVSDQGETW